MFSKQMFPFRLWLFKNSSHAPNNKDLIVSLVALILTRCVGLFASSEYDLSVHKSFFAYS